MEQVHGVNAHKRNPIVVLILRTHRISNEVHNNMKMAKDVILSVATVVCNMLRNNALHMANNAKTVGNSTTSTNGAEAKKST